MLTHRYPRPFTLANVLRMAAEEITLPPVWLGALRLLVRIALVLAAAYGVHLLMDWATSHAEAVGNDRLMIGVFATFLLVYAVLIAVPFMPGVEIGVSLLMMQGASIAPFVYVATILGLVLAFLVGRFLPYRWLYTVLADMRLKRACELVNRLEPLGVKDRLAVLEERVPGWARPLVGPWRYLLLAILINIPGNSVIGGGGGIALTAGITRLFRPGWTALTFALATAPVPLMVWLWGTQVLK